MRLKNAGMSSLCSWLLVAWAAVAVSGCCSGPKCRDLASGADRERTRAKPIKLNTVSDDSVSAPKKDATDWKSVVLAKSGKLTAELHWDKGESRLSIAVYDTLGKRIAAGADWGQKGQRVILPMVKPGRYFIRVRAEGPDDASAYSLRVIFERRAAKPTGACHNCTVGERICLKSDGYAICQTTKAGCNAWGRTFSCPSGQSCKDGKCIVGCSNQCKAEERRCADSKRYQICRQTALGCLQWSVIAPCPRRRRCVRGRCRKYKGKKPPKVVKNVGKKPPKSPGGKGNGKIISIYRYRGRMTLYIEIGNDSGISAGATGFVLRGTTGKPLAGGEIKVTKISGRFCIATTSLNKLGKNRWVYIRK